MTVTIALNLKAYPESSGKRAIALLKITEAQQARTKNAQFILIPNLLDSALIASNASRVKIFVQYADAVPAGSHTGHVPIELLPVAGIRGVLINHAECRLPFIAIKHRVELARKFKLETLICAKDDLEASKLAKLKPTYVAVEPLELIGGKISISTAKPELVKKSVSAVKKVNSGVKVLIGAGISSSQDLKIALKLGAYGVLAASAFVKSKNPKKWLKKLLST